MNTVHLIGRITHEPTLKRVPGKAVINFSLAVNRRKNKEETTYFINCVAWNRVAEIICNYTTKGSQLGIKGHLQTKSYENQKKQKIYITEVCVEEVYLLDCRHSMKKDNVNTCIDDLPF